MESTPLWMALQRVGRRLLAIKLAAGLGWSLVGAIGIVLVGVWLDLLWDLPPELRIACLLVAGSAVLLLFGIAWRLAVQQYAPGALARRLDASGGTGGQILSGVDLLQLQDAQANDLTGGLAKLAAVQAGQLAQKIPPSTAVPGRPVGWSLGSLLGIALVVALACLLMPRLAWTQWQRFTDPFADHSPFSRVVFHVQPGNVAVLYGQGLDIHATTEGAAVERLDLILQTDGVTGVEVLPMFPEPNGAWRATLASVTAAGKYYVRSREGRSERFDITVVTVPRIENVRFRVTPPSYTNRPPLEGPLPQGGLAGLPGTKVQVWAKSNRPLGGGTLRQPTDTAAPVKLQPLTEGSTEVAGEFEIRHGGKLLLHVTDVAGQASTEPFTAPIVLLADERPFVRIMEPREQSFATPTATIPVSIAAEDDYGIARLQLFRSLNEARALPLDLPVKQPAPLRWSEMHLLPLSAYGLQPGDEIKLFARVEDTDPAGPKGAESSVVVVRIVAQEEFEKMLRQREGLEVLLSKYQEAQRRLEALAEEMERLEKELEKAPPGQRARPGDAEGTGEARRADPEGSRGDSQVGPARAAL